MTQMPNPNYASSGPYGEAKNNGLGVAAMICGILALLLAFIPGLNFCLSLPVALVALGLGIAGWITASGKPNQKATFAIIGVVAAVLSVGLMFLVNAIIGTAIQGWGEGVAGRATVIETAQNDAETAVGEARQRGVSEDVISRELGIFQSTIASFAMDTFGGDAAEMQTKADAALQKLKDNLAAAPAVDDGDTTGDMSDDAGMTDDDDITLDPTDDQ